MNNCKTLNNECKQWKESVAMDASKNPIVMFVISVASSPLITTMLGSPAVAFNIYGESGTGKTTLLNCASSLWGAKHRTTFFNDYDRIINKARCFNFEFLSIDELDASTFETAVNLERMLSGHNNNSRYQAQTTVLTGGEITYSRRCNTDDYGELINQPQAMTRKAFFIDVPLFESLGAVYSSMLSDKVRVNSTGAISEAIQIKLESSDIDLGYEFQEAQGRLEDTGIKGRYLTGFAIAALSGELITTMGLTGWEKGAAEKAARLIAMETIKAGNNHDDSLA